MKVEGKKTIATKLNLDTHTKLLEQRDLVYLLNGDITGYENNNNNLFVQNCLSNGLCVNFPQGYIYQNGIYLDNFEYLVFFYKSAGNQSEIGLFNSNDCSYQTIVNSQCLNLQKPIRGVYKRLNSSNERVAYWVDGLNPDRYINVDKALNGDYPKKTTALLSGSCAICNSEIIDELDCNKLRFNREFIPTCLSLKSNKQGGFTTGTYQVAIAYGDDNFTFTDFYFSDVIKVHSQDKYDIGFEVSIDCKYSPFSTFRVVLITQTKEGSLIAYDYGFYPASSTFITLNNDTNASVINVTEVLTKRVLYDHSEHITSNDETLLRGKHRVVEPLEYQSRANEIDVSWVVKKVSYKKAHLYPNFMRDEVYDFSIEWIDELGRERGNFHIPGRSKDEGWVLNAFGVPLHESDAPTLYYNIESLEDCPVLPTEIWQIENTAYVTETYTVDCPDCEENNISQVGKMGYYECQDILYPDEDRWGSLRCTPVRRHRMPPNEICHIHNNGSCVTTTESTTAWSGLLGSLVNTEYNVRDFAPNPCVNILGIRLDNIQIPYIDGVPMLNWSYRLCYSDRQGNKSVLHKGLIFNVWKEIDDGTEIMYPNYPYNDLNPDKYLSKTQTEEYPSGSPDYTNADDYFRTKFTYHSPDIHFKETQNEFGSELRFYTEEIGKVKGEFKESYRHPKVAIGADVPDVKTSWPYAQQFNSAAHYESFIPFPYHLEKRRKIDFSQYLLPIKQLINGKRFNNDMRETSYFMELSDDRVVPNPVNKDVSRLSRSELVDCRNKIDFCETYGVNEDPIQGVSYYVGVKVKQPNQYGQLSGIKYKPVESCYRQVTELILNGQDFFGGDIHISRHSVLRKMPLFREWLYDVPYNTETDYRDKRNVWYPIFWYDNLTVSADLYRLSCYQADTLEENGDEGYIYTWVTGNLYFWCESEFIGDYREIDNTPNSRYYPKVDFNEIAKVDNISLQPTFLYDFSLNNSTVETKYLSTYTKSDAQFTVSYSLKNDLQSSGDNWLKFLPLNYSILPQVYGDFTGLHYVDQYSIFFVFENMVLYSQEDYTLQTVQGNSVFLGQGDIFSRRLGKLSNDKTGYTGSVDPLSFINTRFGTFFFDRLRKRFFQWTGQLKELEGITSWLQLHSNYDSRTQGYDTSMIAVWDNYTEKIYFTDRINNWTISYDPKHDGFISFHSFIPSWYLHLPNNFVSVKNGTNGFWKHNKIGDYQRYYGIPYSFDIGFVENQVQDVDFQSISIDAEFYKYNGYLDKTYVKDRFFDRALFYNHQGSTGILDLYLKNKNNPKDNLVQSKDQHNIAEVTHVKGITYNINQLENNHLGQNLPMINLDSDGVTYHPVNTGVKVPTEREEIKGSWLRCHLISDNKESEKIIVHLNTPDITPIQR